MERIIKQIIHQIKQIIQKIKLISTILQLFLITQQKIKLKIHKYRIIQTVKIKLIKQNLRIKK